MRNSHVFVSTFKRWVPDQLHQCRQTRPRWLLGQLFVTIPRLLHHPKQLPWKDHVVFIVFHPVRSRRNPMSTGHPNSAGRVCSSSGWFPDGGMWSMNLGRWNFGGVLILISAVGLLAVATKIIYPKNRDEAGASRNIGKIKRKPPWSEWSAMFALLLGGFNLPINTSVSYLYTVGFNIYVDPYRQYIEQLMLMIDVFVWNILKPPNNLPSAHEVRLVPFDMPRPCRQHHACTATWMMMHQWWC